METVGDIGTRSSAGCQALAFGGPVSIRIQQPCARCFCLIHFCRHTFSKGANNKWVPVIQMLRAWTLKLPIEERYVMPFWCNSRHFSGSSEGPGMVDALKLAQANQPDTKGTWELVCNLFPCTRAIRRCPCFRVWLGLRGFRSICCPKDPQP